jgi:hypothetical protein
MGIFESIREGVLGLLLFTGNWFLPQDTHPTLAIEKIHKTKESAYEVTVVLDMALNQRIVQLVDAGVPLRFHYKAYTPSDTISLFRTLSCNVLDYSYTFTDSGATFYKQSKRYPMILLAIRDMGRWRFSIEKSSSVCYVEMIMLSSMATQLDRKIDMSRLWGQQKITIAFSPAERRR